MHQYRREGQPRIPHCKLTATDKSGATVTRTTSCERRQPEPIATDDTGSTGQDNTLVVDHRTEGVLGNDTDQDGDALCLAR